MYGETAQIAQSPRPMPELGRLKAAAERVHNAQGRIANFIDRFHGPMPEACSSVTAASPTDSYRNDLESLFIQIERLENVVSALDGVG